MSISTFYYLTENKIITMSTFYIFGLVVCKKNTFGPSIFIYSWMVPILLFGNTFSPMLSYLHLNMVSSNIKD